MKKIFSLDLMGDSKNYEKLLNYRQVSKKEFDNFIAENHDVLEKMLGKEGFIYYFKKNVHPKINSEAFYISGHGEDSLCYIRCQENLESFREK